MGKEIEYDLIYAISENVVNFTKIVVDQYFETMLVTFFFVNTLSILSLIKCL